MRIFPNSFILDHMKIMIRGLVCLSLVFILGCHSNESGTQSSGGENVSAAPLPPSGIDWQKVTAQAPRKSPDLTLWLSADAKVVLAPDGNTVVSWTDESNNHVEFQKPPTDHDGPVFVKSSSGHPGAAILFTGKDQQLVSGDIRGSKLSGATETSFFIVMRENSPGGVSDTIGWGGCGDNRLNSHLTAGNSLVFQMGNSGVSAIGTGAPAGWAKTLHVVSVVIKGKEARMSLDGVEILSSAQFKNTLNVEAQAPITIAGICSNGFNGEISEVLLFKKGLPRTKEQQILKSLAEKYSLQLR